MTGFRALGPAFDAVRVRHGARAALRYAAVEGRPQQELTYAQLGHLADRLTAALHARGLVRGQVLALFHDKSPWAYAAMLAALRLGVLYVNLDPESPWPRLEKILDSCQPALILQGEEPLAFATELAAQTRPVERGSYFAESEPLVDLGMLPIPAIGPASPAYIMFTSGSTGVPKGAVMSHGNVLGFISWAQDRFGITPTDVMTNVNPMYFDNSVFDFYGALFAGAALVPFDRSTLRDPRRLMNGVAATDCTFWFSVPSLLVYLLTTRALNPGRLPRLRTVAFGGEGFPKPRLRELHALFGDRVVFENVYGPTECTCICSAHAVAPSDLDEGQGLVPLGRLAPDFDHEILPLDPADPATGELFLRGPQVGLGYYNDPVRSTAAFVQNPLHSSYFDRGYRTGDLVHRDRQGLLHFRGRIDQQIKHQGYRIELGEIEAALSALPDVNECAAIYLRGHDGQGHILAYVAAAPSCSARQLQDKLAGLLPAYMRPRRLVLQDELPKNANGKIDRLALLELSQSMP